MGWLGGKLLITTMGIAWRCTFPVEIDLQQNGNVEADLKLN